MKAITWAGTGSPGIEGLREGGTEHDVWRVSIFCILGPPKRREKRKKVAEVKVEMRLIT